MKRNGEIDFLKFFFAAIIVLYHSKNFATNINPILLNQVAVEFFFIVSGYLMASSSERGYQNLKLGSSIAKETSNFLIKKIKILLPEYYVAWLLAFIITVIIKKTTFLTILHNLLLSIFELSFIQQSGLIGYHTNHVTWYLSAMLISMFILYPILLKFRSTFLYILAPLAVILIYGWMYQTFSSALGSPSVWCVFALKGLIRAIAAICLGCVSYTINKKLENYDTTKLLSVIFALFELLIYIVMLYITMHYKHNIYDYLLVFLLAISITIGFSKKSLFYSLFDKPLCSKLGKFSFPLFLSHGYWSHFMLALFPNQSYYEILPKYLIIVTINAFVLLFISNKIRNYFSNNSDKIKSLFIKVS